MFIAAPFAYYMQTTFVELEYNVFIARICPKFLTGTRNPKPPTLPPLHQHTAKAPH